MAIIEWSPELETGVFEIDLQHRSLLAIANQLHDAIRGGRSTRTVEWMFEELALYAKFHFDTEDAYMRRYGVEDAERHRLEHGELLAAIKRFRRKLKAADERVQDEVPAFLADWLERHLKGADRQFGLEVRAAMNRPPGKPRKKKTAA